MKTSTQPYEILIRFDDKTGALKGAYFQTIETVTDDVTGAVLFQKPGDPQPLDVAGKLARDLLGATVVSAIAANDDLKAQLAAAKKSATEAAAQDKETALAAKDAEIAKQIKIANVVADELQSQRNAALAAQKTAEDDLESFRARAQEFLRQAPGIDHPELTSWLQAGAAELNKSARQKELEDAQAAADAANAKVEALKAQV